MNKLRYMFKRMKIYNAYNVKDLINDFICIHLQYNDLLYKNNLLGNKYYPLITKY